MRTSSISTLSIALAFGAVLGAAEKPPIGFDEFFDSTGFYSVRVSPDGQAVAIETEQADWKQSRYAHRLWLWRDRGGAKGELIELTRSGRDSEPEWSPDGRWIAFLSDRPAADKEEKEEKQEKEKGEKDRTQLWVISSSGGEAFALTHETESVHAFAWAADSRRVYFATRSPWTKQRKQDHETQWHDVVRYREADRGDAIFSVSAESASAATPVAATPYRVHQMAASPDGTRLVFTTTAPSERVESTEAFGLFLIDLAHGGAIAISRTNAFYENPRWTPDSRGVFFTVTSGSVEGPYRDLQTRLYSVEAAPGARIRRWAGKFPGAIGGYAPASAGGAVAVGISGTQAQVYSQANPESDFVQEPGWGGTYTSISASQHSSRVTFVYSSLTHPVEVYLAESPDRLRSARPITSFNRVFLDRALPEGKPYRWKAGDGAEVEGMLIYPPGKFNAKHLRMLTLIHGGPADAYGDKFAADWYSWALLAASRGWLVFQPNYRGSIGYGDKFALETVPGVVSTPGRDILDGVDALVRDGIADPDRLTIGGYSEGGYLTNWLITQTTRFKAAVTGAGAVEHAVDWGNDDESLDDSFYLGGTPWEARKNYNAEAALWRIDKVKTPTHIVAGAEDVRVYTGEAYLLERALHTLGVPSTLLIFPGEGHGLSVNPWHGKIKVREELAWLEKYAGD